LKVPFTNQIVTHLNDPKPGQIVVFESPKEEGLVLVKRLIAGPGRKEIDLIFIGLARDWH
jgi:hypothetical protein